MTDDDDKKEIDINHKLMQLGGLNSLIDTVVTLKNMEEVHKQVCIALNQVISNGKLIIFLYYQLIIFY